MGKDVDIVIRLTSPHTIRDTTSKGMKDFYALPTNSQYLVNGPNSPEVITRRLPPIVTNAFISKVIEMRSAYVAALLTTHFAQT